MRALIITGGDCADCAVVPPHDLCIAADSGFDTAKKLGVTPNVVMGDFDSLGYVPEDFEVIRHPSHKNDTDTMLAADYAVEKGARELYIIGGLGGRADHTMSNVFLLERLKSEGVDAILTDGDNVLQVMTAGECVHIPHGEYRYFSTVALENTVVSAVGCEYPLDHSNLVRANAYAVSNQTVAGGADVIVHSGTMLLIFSEKL